MELRAATSLARLWRVRHARRSAPANSSPRIGWFHEGFDTRDIIEASAQDERDHAGPGGKLRHTLQHGATWLGKKPRHFKRRLGFSPTFASPRSEHRRRQARKRSHVDSIRAIGSGDVVGFSPSGRIARGGHPSRPCFRIARQRNEKLQGRVSGCDE